MVYLAAALVFVALLGWDVARREIRRRAIASDSTDLRAELDKQAAELSELRKGIETQKEALVKAFQEMRGLLAPVRRAVLQAVPDETRVQRKEG